MSSRFQYSSVKVLNEKRILEKGGSLQRFIGASHIELASYLNSGVTVEMDVAALRAPVT